MPSIRSIGGRLPFVFLLLFLVACGGADPSGEANDAAPAPDAPHVDPFSTYGAAHSWIAYTWLFDVLLYGFHAAAGMAGVMVFVSILWAVFAYTLFDLGR